MKKALFTSVDLSGSLMLFAGFTTSSYKQKTINSGQDLIQAIFEKYNKLPIDRNQFV